MEPISSYPDWKAPAEDSAVLIWPDPPELLAQTRENFRRLESSDCRIGNESLATLRHRQRQALNLPMDRPVIADGHQTELYHSGVWAKLGLINVAAKRLDAEAIHLGVDTDTPKHLQIHWPGGSWPITDDPSSMTAQWSGLLSAPSAKHLQEIRTSLAEAAADWPFEPLALKFLDELREIKPNLSAAITDAEHRLDESLGLSHRAILASPIWGGEPYLSLVHHLLARADEFGAIYNEALREYRVQHRLRTTARPMPDLQLLPNRCESPFWVDDLRTGGRERALIHRHGNGWKFCIDKDPFPLQLDSPNAGEDLKNFLAAHNARLSPRALTLTLFMRLLVADQFVHGIGGGRYDQVTNRVIEKFFRLTPPDFSVSTATLYFPTALSRTRVCLPCLAREGHRLRHGLLGDKKMQLITQITESPRRSKRRKEIFMQMHQNLTTALLRDPRVESWQQRVTDSNRLLIEEQALFDRELFYAIQPRERLQAILDKYQQAFP